LDEVITEKIQALQDKCMSGCAAPLFMNAQNAAAQLLVRKIHIPSFELAEQINLARSRKEHTIVGMRGRSSAG